jgi:hypothetical protein
MRRIAFAFVALSFISSGVVPAQAASKATIVTAAFKALLNQSATSLQALEDQFEADIDKLDSALAETTALANSTYDADFTAATNLYSPQISSSNAKISEAKSKFASVSSVKVLSLGTNRNYWGNLNCPATRMDCKDAGDKGEKFIVGEITSVKEILSTTSLDYLPEIDIMVSQGLIELLKPSEFQAVASTLKNEPNTLKSIALKFSEAQTSARNKQSRSITSAKAVRDEAVLELEDALEAAKAQIEAQETAANLALLAAKRATKDSAKFDSAFAIAYKFEYNRQMVGEIADAAWNGEWTYRTIDTIIEVNKLAAYGDSVGRRYSMSEAIKFNSAVGGAFTSEPDFRAALKILTTTYKKVTKVNLKF